MSMDAEATGLHQRRSINSAKNGAHGGDDIEEDKDVGHSDAAKPCWKRLLQSMFGMDVRALAASRILAACVLLYESLCGMDWWNIKAFLTDSGIWPIKAIASYSDAGLWQLHLLHRGVSWAYFLNFLFLLSALLLLVGWHTRKASLFCWVYWVSVQSRCYPMGHSFDKQLQFLLMWATLGLPWNACWSIDAALAWKGGKGHVQKDRMVCSLATFGLCVETVVIYFLTSFHKTHPSWADGTAVIFALETRYISRPLAHALLENAVTRPLLLIAGQAARPLEMIAPVAMLMPWAPLKILAVLALVGFHVGLGITLRLNDIPFINTSVLLLFLPTLFWDRLQAAWLLMAPPRISMQPWQKMREVALTLQGLGLAAPASVAQEPEAQKPALWATRMKHKGHFVSKALIKVLAIWVITFRIWSSIAVVCGGGAQEPCTHRSWTMWPWMADAGKNVLRLDTNWKVFSPRPPSQDVWYVFPAKLENNRSIDIFSALHGPKYFQEPFSDVTYDAPAAPAYTFRDERWTKYLESVVAPGWKDDAEKEKSNAIRSWLGQFLCREWNARNGKGPHRLVTFEMIMFLTDIPEKVWTKAEVRTKRANPEKVVMWGHQC